ncbi:MAG: DNA polymerase [Candidatus Parvarchaeum sp.]
MERLKFKGIDGEGIKGDNGDKYILLKCHELEPLINPQGLGTKEIIDFLFTIPEGYTLVGYGLGYDFENWLIDLTQEEYRKLITGQRIWFERYKTSIRMVTEKLITVRKYLNGKMQERTVYNILHFFQTSFIEALKSFDLDDLVDDTIVSGKENRGRFTLDQLEQIIYYNKVEVAALTKLMETFYHFVLEAFEKSGVGLEFSEDMLASPGKFGRQLLEITNWSKEHPQYKIPSAAIPDWKSSLAGLHPYKASTEMPFAAAYYGGRIECGSLGSYPKLYVNDIRSAYPKGVTLLPSWKYDDFIYTNNAETIQKALIMRNIGMYYVEWNFPNDWDYYPFPFRSKKKNVIFPSQGRSWLMSPEVFAAIDTGLVDFKITRAVILKHTEGEGAGILKRNESTTAKAVKTIYDKRSEFKKEKNGAEKPLKLVLNAMYGVIFEGLGETFSDLAGAWITSWTRATLWRAIAPHKQGHIIVQLMTDSVFSKLPLMLPVNEELGSWESSIYYDCRILLPGIYDWHTADGARKSKIRGHSKAFDFDAAYAVLAGKSPQYVYEYSHFVQHLQSYTQKNKYGDKLCQWVTATKDYIPSLSTKRKDTPAGIRIPAGESEKWCPPINNDEVLISSQSRLDTFTSSPSLTPSSLNT